ncbi:MAG: hydrolase TatD [Planctomycetaceae bacterium]|nr:hydrolase TatD [Planctomycetaceae bacterium]
MTPLIDTHAHLDEPRFDPDRDDVVARAEQAGLRAVVCIGTTADSSVAAVELAQQHSLLYAAVGIQPNYVAEAKPDDWDRVRELVGRPKVVAVGETGLDRYWDYAPIELQAEYFSKHIAVARERDLPFIVHCREAEEDVVSQLRAEAAHGPLKGVMHSFCGSPHTAVACLELGLHISFAGMLTFKKNKDLRALAATIPLDRLLVETDAPYLAPTPNRGKRNEPAFVQYTAACLAEVHEMPVEQMAKQTTDNARKLFAL